MAALLFALTASAALAAPPTTPPFTECPAVDADTSCQFLIVVTGTGTAQNVQVLEDSSQPFYDNTDDSLVGIVNDSALPLSSIDIGVDNSGDDDFGFDGDGMCNPDGPPVPVGCPFAGTGGADDPYDYEGPDTSYVAADGGTSSDAGTVDFTTALAPNGGTTFFSLEASPVPLAAGTSPQAYYINTTLTNSADSSDTVENGQLTETAPVNVTDQASFVGSGAPTSGTVVYRLYTGDTCAAASAVKNGNTPYASSVDLTASDDGTAPASTAIGLKPALANNATYYWQVSYYLADASTTGTPAAITPCGEETMVFGTPPTNTTTLAATASGAGQSGGTINVPAGTSVTATATLTPTSKTAPSGEVYYTWYDDSACTLQAAGAGSATVMNGVAGQSSAVTLPAGGTYYLQVVYSGDGTNAPATFCGLATANVAAVQTSSTSTSTAVTPPATTTSTTTTATQSVLGTSQTVNLPAPTLFKTVNVYPVSGKVYIKLPPGATLARVNSGLAHASTTKGVGFIPLTQARQIPVGSVLDTTGGTVAITAASPIKGRLYTGDFTAGIFQLLQSRKEKGLAQINLRDTVSNRVCKTIGKGARASAARKVSNKVLGLLKSTDNGKFSTRGDYSSATVRGTAYSVEDTCAGTLTTVTRGSVVVDYFRRHKSLIVRAGHAFLAKASGGPSVVVTIGKKASAAAAAELSAVL